MKNHADGRFRRTVQTPDMARLVCMFPWSAMSAMSRCDWYGEWVPSKANLGDIMTRPERFHELLEGLRRYQVVQRGEPEGSGGV